MNAKTVAYATAILASVLARGAAFAAEPSTGELIQLVSVKDARDLLTEAGAKVEKVDFDQDGFTITAALSPERHVWFEGMACKGAGDAMACPEFKILARWQLDTEAHAADLARQLNYNYTSVFADGASLDLWRMDFTYGGITREHLRRTVLEVLDLRQQAENVIWPPIITKSPAPRPK